MKLNKILLTAAIAALVQLNAAAQISAPSPTPELKAQAVTTPVSNTEPLAVTRPNTAIIPVSRTGGIVNRQTLVLERAKAAPGYYDIEFIGDSITQKWEDAGAAVWKELGLKYKLINMGVSGDRTQHVLWRFEQGQLDGINAKVAVVMIGTNNTGKGNNTPAEILAGVTAVVKQIRVRQPNTKIILLAIFPRGNTFNERRADLLQVNQALSRLDDGSNVFYLDFTAQLIEDDGSIHESMMKDFLHPGEKGYRIWAAALEPMLNVFLARK